MKKTAEEAAKEYQVKVYADVYEEGSLAEQELQCINDFIAGAAFFKEQMFEFVNWAGRNFIRLEKVWVGHYMDQRDKANWYTTEELYERWKKQGNGE